MRLSLILLLIYLSISMLGYAFVEIHIRWNSYRKKTWIVATETTTQ